MPEFKLEQVDGREYMLVISEIQVDEGPDRLSLWIDQEEAMQLYATAEECIGDFVRQMRREKAAFERSRWADEPELLDPSDPKSEGYYERAVEAYDNRETPRAERWDW